VAEVGLADLAGAGLVELATDTHMPEHEGQLAVVDAGAVDGGWGRAAFAALATFTAFSPFTAGTENGHGAAAFSPFAAFTTMAGFTAFATVTGLPTFTAGGGQKQLAGGVGFGFGRGLPGVSGGAAE
jgi:hypothetical protein